MSAISDRVLTVNLIANTVIFYVAARLYLLPLVPRVRPQVILVPILLLHSMRHLGLMFLTRGATFPGIPPQFAYPAAFGDLITAVLAFVAIPLVLRSSGLAKPMVWTFNIFGTLDLLTAITLARFMVRQRQWDRRTGFRLLGSAVIGNPLRDFHSAEPASGLSGLVSTPGAEYMPARLASNCA